MVYTYVHFNYLTWAMPGKHRGMYNKKG